MPSNFNPSSIISMIGKEDFATGKKGRKLKEKREHLVQWLRKKGKGSAKHLALANKLEGCERKARCFSGACPECTAAAQRFFAIAACGFLKRWEKGFGKKAKLVCVSVVPDDGGTKVGKLSKANHDRALRRWRDRFGRSIGSMFIGATDISLNEHLQGRYKRHWSEHIYGVTVTTDLADLKKDLRKQFPSTLKVPRPVRVTEWDGSKKALRYIFKPNFWRRIADDKTSRFNKKTGKTRKCRTTTKARLRSRHRLELSLYLDDVGIPGRVFLRWCQLKKTKTGEIALVPRVPEIQDEP